MKKLQKLALALVASSSVLSASAFAADNQFYITAGGGVLFSDKQLNNFGNGYTVAGQTSATPPAIANTNTFTLKKAKTNAEMFVGVGYYVTDKIRAEAVFVKPWFGKQTINQSNVTVTTPAGGSAGQPVTTAYHGKLTSQVNSVQLKGYYDAFDIADMGKAYVGAGIGWSQVQAKFDTNDAVIVNVKTKNKNNFAWTVAVGAAFDVVEEVKLGLEYNYQDFGHVKNPLVAPAGATAVTGNNAGKIRFHGHAIVAKLMFNV